MSARCGRSATRYDLVQFVHTQASPRAAGPPLRQSHTHQEATQVAKSGIFTGLEAGLDGVPQVGVLDFEPDRYVGRPRIRADAGLRGTCAGWAKVRLKTRHYREQQTKECVSHVPRGRDRPPVHAQHATTAARVVRCPFVRNTLHGVIFLMQCLD